MKSRRRTIGILLAVLLAGAGTAALVSYVQSAKDSALAAEALVDVYVVDKVIPKGSDAAAIRSSISLEKVPGAPQAARGHHLGRGHRDAAGRDRPPAG